MMIKKKIDLFINFNNIFVFRLIYIFFLFISINQFIFRPYKILITYIICLLIILEYLHSIICDKSNSCASLIMKINDHFTIKQIIIKHVFF